MKNGQPNLLERSAERKGLREGSAPPEKEADRKMEATQMEAARPLGFRERSGHTKADKLLLILLDHPGRYLYGDQSLVSDLRRLWGSLPFVGPDTL
jgi:hypothetical protein